MKLRPALAAALLLPIIGFGASWAMTHQKAQLGTDWDVPIAGYDPRDFLRGHYLQFRYEWPGLVAQENGNMPWYSVLCIEGSAPKITRVSDGESDTNAKCASIARAPDDGLTSLFDSRYYVPQTKAAGLEQKLRDPKLQAVMRVRIREDGVVTPKSLSFRPRTAAEIAARAAPETEQPPAPEFISQ
jgi:uncharacterized membrane-anchored protein